MKDDEKTFIKADYKPVFHRLFERLVTFLVRSGMACFG
jgi:hypothetical protein